MNTTRCTERSGRGRLSWSHLGRTTALVLATVSPALAQQEAKMPGEDNYLLTWGIAFGVVLVVCATAFINPKRSHLD